MPRLISSILTGLSALLFTAAAQAEIDSDLLDGMSARAIGPATMSGRVAAIDAVENDPNIIYVGAATGGVWKSVNGGLNWEPIFDDQDVASIGALAIYQAAPEIVWVGTGEGNVRNSTSIGGGIFKSMDGGRTWAKLGLEGTERINRIALHPTNPEIAYVAALGTLWGENSERGVYKTTDGGKSWSKILYTDQTTGATDVKIDPANPDKLYAAMWQFRRWPYHFKSGGPGSGLYLSYDGGKTWERKTEEDGLPEGELGRIVIAPSPANPARVYALVEAEKSAVVRSDDGGETWTKTNEETNIAVRPFYYSEMLADPDDPDTIYNIASRVSVSIDGGKTFEFIPGINCCSAPNQVHIDTHDMWINSTDPEHMIVGNDGGLAVSRDKGATWRFVANLPLAQFYHINVDNDVPYNIYGGLQDNGTFRGPAEVWENGGIKNLHWQEIGFGDGFDVSPDPEDSMRGYSMSQGGNLMRWNLHTGVLQMIRPDAPKAEDGSDIELRFNWSAGFAQDPFDNGTIYYGSQFVHKSTDRGRSWSVISGDLTTNNPDWQTYKVTGGLTPDVTAAEFYTSITAVAASALKQGVIWVGSDDGRVHVTQDGGASWASIEGKAHKGRGSVPKNSWVPHIEPSPHDASVAFVVFDDHRRSNMKPYIYRVENYGKRWVNITTRDIAGYALSVQQDHLDPNLLFLGTEFGLYVSTNAGKSWFKWTAGVPTVSVMDMAIQERENDLVLGTHGRALYVIDDYSALRGLNEADFNERLKILSVTDGQQYAPRQSPSTRFDASGGFRAPNEPYGAVVTFMMSGDDLTHPDADKDRNRRIAARKSDNGDSDNDDNDEGNGKKEEKITVTVTNAAGEVIRTFKATVQQGINRVVWGHEVDGARRMPSKRPAEDQLPRGPQVVPGTYGITLKYGDAEASVEARVLADPRFEVSAVDRQKNFAHRQRMAALAGTAADAVERLINARADIDVIAGLASKAAGKDAGEDDPNAALGKESEELKEKLEALELHIRTLPDTKGYIYDADKVTSLIGMAQYYMGSSFDAPSPAALAYAEDAEQALERSVSEINAVFAGEVAAFREKAEGLGLAPLMAGEPLAVPAE